MSDEAAPVRISAGQVAGGHFRYYDFVMAAFCVVLVLSNVVGAAKVATLGGLTFGAGILFFPLSYVLGDVLTEIYGYARARRVIWAGFGATVFGQGVDSLIFYPLAFLGVWTTEQVVTVMLTNWGLKVLWEVVLTPVTYAVVGFLKRREGVDVFDEGTDFTPFRTRV